MKFFNDDDKLNDENPYEEDENDYNEDEHQDDELDHVLPDS